MFDELGDNCQLRIVDFGISAQYNNKRDILKDGYSYYIAPELIKDYVGSD